MSSSSATRQKRRAHGSGDNTTLLPRPDASLVTYRVEVLRVIDGDTLHLRIDLGFETERPDRFRLADIDAPRVRHPGRSRRHEIRLPQQLPEHFLAPLDATGTARGR